MLAVRAAVWCGHVGRAGQEEPLPGAHTGMGGSPEGSANRTIITFPLLISSVPKHSALCPYRWMNVYGIP